MIKWNGDSDDLTAKIGLYTLRVEQMDVGRWWWCVYFDGEMVACDSINEKFANTKQKAQYYCVYHNNKLKSTKNDTTTNRRNRIVTGKLFIN